MEKAAENYGDTPNRLADDDARAGGHGRDDEVVHQRSLPIF